MTFRINNEDDPIIGPPPEPVNWDNLIPPPHSFFKGFTLALVSSFLLVTLWGLAIYGAYTLINQ